VDKSNFSVEAIISCDDRGQIVLPKDIRKRLNINSGEKLALLNISTGKEDFFLTLIKANSLEKLIKNYMTPVMENMIK